ncbi:hypothetical protein J437_LFUL009306 [Ladona fulva]|uniref:Estradiol 17-beta-dehydrogenase 2 n=1 Tax=Ladona fulva TaxID=123851 RepID=A0A8K0K592_LADFU|nr:hypothetical protein J437_LFUL009306 [Ladona fulva]
MGATSSSLKRLVVGGTHGQKALVTFAAAVLAIVGRRLWISWESNRRRRLIENYEPKRAILITGCDSGLGFSLALRTHDLGLWVFATCLREDGIGARRLRELCPNSQRLHVLKMDVTDATSVFTARDIVMKLIKKNGLELGTLVNNAGVMVFGEFEWQTERLIKFQTDVNLLGTYRVTKAFCPELRKSKGRILTVSSHCAEATLPGLAVYGATKAAIEAWSDGLRVEVAKYGIQVITIFPGSFAQRSNLAGLQGEYAAEMKAAMNKEQQEFYGEFFNRYQTYLNAVFSAGPRTPDALKDDSLYYTFEEALLSRNPRSRYRAPAPVRYVIYHSLFKMAPTTWLRDWLVQRFVQMPAWEP